MKTFSKMLLSIIFSFALILSGYLLSFNTCPSTTAPDETTKIVASSTNDSEDFDDQNFVYKNWVENDQNRNDYEVQTDIIPSESLSYANGYYQINSIEDWLYLLVYSTSLYHAYYSLNCDIILNDGYFDDDGTYHDGGDGVCYVSSPVGRGNYITFKGNGHTIKGFYIDDSKMSEEMLAEKGGRHLSMFRINNYLTAENLYIENIYLNAVGSYYAMGLAYYTKNITNVHILSGAIRAGSNSAGFSYDGTITNCTNRANIYSGEKDSGSAGRTSGIAQVGILINCINYGNVTSTKAQMTMGIGGSYGGSATNCKNYGKITGGGNYTCGITQRGKSIDCINYGEIVGNSNAFGIGDQGSTFENCINYGRITQKSSYYNSAGIGQARIMKDCKNYGDIIAQGHASGILAGTYNTNSLINCINYGKVSSAKSYASGILASFVYSAYNCVNYGDVSGASVGGISATSTFETIKNCSNYGSLISKGSYIGGLIGLFSNTASNRTIKNCKVDCAINGTAQYAGALVGYIEQTNGLTIDNCKFNLDENLDSEFGFIIGQLGASKKTSTDILIRNCDITTKTNGEGVNYVIVGNTLGKITTQSVLIKEIGGDSSPLIVKSSTGKENFESLIIEKEGYKAYYGTDFSNYYKSWRTGKIGLVSIDGRGTFQSKVTKETLNKLGYINLGPVFEDVTFEDCTILEYIESTGTQWIDTGYIPSSNTSCYFDFQYLGATNTSQTWCFLGGARSSSIHYTFAINRTGGYLRYEYNPTNNYVETSTVNQRSIVETNKNIITTNGTEQRLTEKDFQCEYNMYLFELNDKGTVTNRGAKIKLYACKIYEGDLLMRDFVPVLTDDGAIGLYDTVENKFYGNSGTGSFDIGLLA